MVKTLLCIPAFLVSLLAFPQDWALFQPGQLMYYHINSDTGMTVLTQRLDSVRPTANGDVHYFKLYNGPDHLRACWNEAFYPDHLPNWTYNLFLMDSLLVRNDTAFGYAGPGYGPYYFLPHVEVGGSWTAPLITGGGPQQTTFTCISKEEETFLGITDSVKTFSINTVGNSVPPINDIVIKLSKSHGLMEFLPLGLTVPHSTLPVRTFRLIGLNDGNTHGYAQPRFADYFRLSAGDILQWQQNYQPAMITEPSWIRFHQDSITHVLITPDSVVYTFNRTTLNEDLSLLGQYSGLKTTFREREFRYMAGAQTDSYALGANSYSNQGWDGMPLWYSGRLQLRADPLSGDTTTSIDFMSQAMTFDTSACLIIGVTDLSSELVLDSRVGIMRHCMSFTTSMDCSQLIGWRINGVVTGDLKWTTGVAQLESAQVALRPNPVHDAFVIDGLSAGSGAQLELFGLSGHRVLQADWRGSPIAVDKLEPGVYLLRLVSAEGVRVLRFVKE